MKSKIYTEKEIQSLNKNPFVIKVIRNRFIEYDPLFKLWAILERKLYPEKTCKELFRYAGFNTSVMNPKLPQSRIRSWENVFMRYGYEYFLDDKDYSLLSSLLLKDVSIKDEIYTEYIKRRLYRELSEHIKEIQELEKGSSFKN